MRTILLIKEHAGSDDLELSHWPPLGILKGEARIGCTCDFWGHPCPKCSSVMRGKKNVKEVRRENVGNTVK